MIDQQSEPLPGPGPSVPDDACSATDDTVPSNEKSRKAAPSTLRRGFLKAGLAAVPMVLTLRSRPAWGQTGEDPSGTLSGASQDPVTNEVPNPSTSSQSAPEDPPWYEDPPPEGGDSGDGDDGGDSGDGDDW